MKPRALAAAVALAVLLVSAGGYYVYVNSTQQPTVTLKEIEYAGSESVNVLGVDVPKQLKFNVSLDVENPNMLSLKVTGAYYQLYLNDEPVGEGSIKGPVEVPARSGKELTSEVDISVLSGAKGLLEYLQGREIALTARGSATVELPLVGVQTIPFEERQNIT
ncbi:MAG: hypothetical protein GF416_00150 [Candidatus Altiarchaeales archaeon]|nr:hypothetical protein [Candidatus Altiarchaeales archaeon]MBD3415532.1 hypothetical protein [Candidatus Altiarchaeales archaeon]